MILLFNYINFNAKKVDNPTNKPTINELVKITCLWCTNICIICDTNDNFAAPFGGFIWSLLAKGDNKKERLIFKIIEIIEEKIIKLLSLFIYIYKILYKYIIFYIIIMSGDAKNGAKIFKAKCSTCHTINEGGPNKQGPNLYAVLGRQSGQVPGFKYTDANKKSGIIWSDQNMFDYLTNPKKYIKGTNMAFPGFKKKQDKLDVIAYLNEFK